MLLVPKKRSSKSGQAARPRKVAEIKKRPRVETRGRPFGEHECELGFLYSYRFYLGEQ